MFWTKSTEVGRAMSVKKRHDLRLTMHAEVVSFNMVVKLIDKADRLQKTGV